jgi:hypothetical protein
MDAPYAAPAYQNRRTGLIIFGIALLLFGGLCLLLVPMAAVGQVMSAKMTGVPMNWRMLVPTVVVYGLLGGTFLSLGIGSMKCRRWARAITLVLSWAWLLAGVAALIMFVVMGPAIFKSAADAGGQPLPPSARAIVMVVTIGFLGVFFVIVPAAFVLFYRSANVKATVEALDPQPRWTDACPLPVLAVSLIAGFGAVTVLTMPIAYNGVMPLFGVILTGFLGSVVWAIIAALMAYAAWSIYHLRPVGWWIVVGVFVVLTVSNAVTFSRVELATLYREMGYPEKQIEQIAKFSAFGPKQMTVWALALMVPVLGYLLFIKKYFRRDTPMRSTPAAAT